jgi:hypothetical protein
MQEIVKRMDIPRNIGEDLTRESLKDAELEKVAGGSGSPNQYIAMCYDCPWNHRAEDYDSASESAEKHRRSTGHQTGVVK